MRTDLLVTASRTITTPAPATTRTVGWLILVAVRSRTRAMTEDAKAAQRQMLSPVSIITAVLYAEAADKPDTWAAQILTTLGRAGYTLVRRDEIESASNLCDRRCADFGAMLASVEQS